MYSIVVQNFCFSLFYVLILFDICKAVERIINRHSGASICDNLLQGILFNCFKFFYIEVVLYRFGLIVCNVQITWQTVFSRRITSYGLLQLLLLGQQNLFIIGRVPALVKIFICFRLLPPFQIVFPGVSARRLMEFRRVHAGIEDVVVVGLTAFNFGVEVCFVLELYLENTVCDLLRAVEALETVWTCLK